MNQAPSYPDHHRLVVQRANIIGITEAAVHCYRVNGPDSMEFRYIMRNLCSAVDAFQKLRDGVSRAQHVLALPP